MGLVKSEAQRKANQLQRKSAIAASDHAIINGPKPTTWSARMPAYAGTSLCPDPELRRIPDEEEKDTGTGSGRVSKLL